MYTSRFTKSYSANRTKFGELVKQATFKMSVPGQTTTRLNSPTGCPILPSGEETTKQTTPVSYHLLFRFIGMSAEIRSSPCTLTKMWSQFHVRLLFYMTLILPNNVGLQTHFYIRITVFFCCPVCLSFFVAALTYQTKPLHKDKIFIDFFPPKEKTYCKATLILK